MAKKEKSKTGKFPWIQLLFGGAVGFLTGFFGIWVIPDENKVLYIVLFIVAIILSFYVHIIVHEGGHLLMGLLSGYSFVSFRIGSLLLIKQGENLRWKRFSIPGTAGQCLLKAPGGPDDSYPYFAYNLGGGLMNIITSAIAGISLIFCEGPIVQVVLTSFIVVGIFLAATNLIPLKVSGVANDGYNLKTLGGDEISQKGFWLQLEVNKLQSDGLRLKDMPEEYFHFGSLSEIENPMICGMQLITVQRLIDQRRFDEARVIAEKIYRMPDNSLLLYQNEAGCELLFLEIMGECRAEVIDEILTPQLQKYLKLTKTYPGRQRTLYAYNRLYRHDDQKAEAAKKKFDKVIKTYPMNGDAVGEQELMKLIEGKGATWKE